MQSSVQPVTSNHSVKRSGASAFKRRVRKALRWRYHRVLRKLGRDQRLTVDLVAQPEQFPGARVLEVTRNRRTAFTSPRLYDEQLKLLRQPALEAPAPDLYLLELENVSVVGATMAVIRDGKLLHPELQHTQAIHDDKAADVCRFRDAARRAVDFDVYTRFGGRPPVKVAVHLLKEHSANYYHWLFECLPRLLHFMKHRAGGSGGEKLTILIDADILPAGLEAMHRVLDFPCEIQTVRRGELVACQKLFYVSPFWYSLDNSRNAVRAREDYAVDVQAVHSVREPFRALMSNSTPTRLIYLPRGSTQVRRISNTPEVEALMVRNGFELIEPHHYTFAEQVKIFSSARVVVGPSGAAFSNMIFMQPGTKAVIFSPKQLEVFNYYIFQQLADVPQVELSHLLAVPAKHDDFYVHDDFAVNCADLERLVRELIA